VAVLSADEIERINTRAAEISFARTLLIIFASVFYVIGWSAGRVWFALVWCGLAIKVGWIAGSRREVDISS
jgi:hypothetical protein